MPLDRERSGHGPNDRISYLRLNDFTQKSLVIGDGDICKCLFKKQNYPGKRMQWRNTENLDAARLKVEIFPSPNFDRLKHSVRHEKWVAVLWGYIALK